VNAKYINILKIIILLLVNLRYPWHQRQCKNGYIAILKFFYMTIKCVFYERQMFLKCISL